MTAQHRRREEEVVAQPGSCFLLLLDAAAEEAEVMALSSPVAVVEAAAGVGEVRGLEEEAVVAAI